FKTEGQYSLEFGDKYMRVIRNDGHVLETAQSSSGVTPDVPAVRTVSDHGYTDGDEVFVTGISGMHQLNGRRFKISGATTNTFNLLDQATGDPIDSTDYDAYVSGGTVARIYEIETPYDIDDVMQINYVQSADVMT